MLTIIFRKHKYITPDINQLKLESRIIQLISYKKCKTQRNLTHTTEIHTLVPTKARSEVRLNDLALNRTVLCGKLEHNEFTLGVE